jgi:hypothetical protein
MEIYEHSKLKIGFKTVSKPMSFHIGVKKLISESSKLIANKLLIF